MFENQVYSADGYEVAVDTPEVTPEATPEPETPSEQDEPSNEPTGDEPVAEPELFELPDGRKVDAVTLQKEWKDNFYPEYTRKSQRLAEIEKVTKPVVEENVPVWKKTDYVPQTYAEIIELATQEAEARIEAKKFQEEQSQQQLISQIDAQVAEIKKIDPKLDENALFLHANKYGFRDLVKAHENYRAIQDAKLTVEQRTVKNIQSRKDTPIAGTPGSAPTNSTPAYGEHTKYGSALEYFQSQR